MKVEEGGRRWKKVEEGGDKVRRRWEKVGRSLERR